MQWLLKTRLACTLIFVASSNCALAQIEINFEDLGKFSGPVVVEWIEHDGPDRKMVVMESITFRESSGREWQVPEGAIIDGASIPKFLWTFIGPPFVGNYRRASVFHDYYCQTKMEPWQDVHRMFYLASLTDGVSKPTASMMYAAVRGANPEWVEWMWQSVDTQTMESEWKISVQEYLEIVNFIESKTPSLDEIDEILDIYKSASR